MYWSGGEREWTPAHCSAFSCSRNTGVRATVAQAVGNIPFQWPDGKQQDLQDARVIGVGGEECEKSQFHM